jgi:2-(1,2-epoxy-1,2-dihydrophenyl)acetyl-CoA isomerase
MVEDSLLARDPDGRVELVVAGSVAHLRLVRVAARNAIDPLWVAEFDAAVAAIEGDTGVRAVVISAAGPAFTVGGDLRHFAVHLDRLSAELDDLIRVYHATLVRLADLPVPVVCAVQGGAAGGGLGLLWCSDVVIAAADAVLATGFAEIALSGDGGSSWFLPRLVGMRRAKEMILFNRVLTAAEAVEWGLVSRVVPRDRLEAEAAETAARLAAGPTVAYGEMRRLLWRSLSAGLEDQLEAERQAIVRCGTTADAREGITAFVERRPPSFGGA